MRGVWLFLSLLGAGAASCKAAPTPPGERASAPAASSPASPGPGEHIISLADEKLAAAALKIEPAVEARATSTTSLAGMIEVAPGRVARVGPRASGRITRVQARIGARVAAGAALASVESVEVGQARADYLEALARQQRADTEVERELKLVEARATTEREVVAARTDARVAKIQLRATEERLRAFGAGVPDPKTSSTGGSHVTLTTPIAGAVLEATARVGQTVGPTDTLFVVADLDEVWLLVDVHERLVPRVAEGDRAEVSVLAAPGRTFEGKVEQLGAMVDPTTKSLRARIVLANPDRALKPGMSATAVLARDGAASEPVVTVARTAVQRVDGLPFVFVELSRGRFAMRPVEVGAVTHGRAEIVRGVRSGEPVVTEGSFLLKSELLRDQMGKND
ncbi:MAG: efflux RND transporter periplasmic adaptor subunit [Polyangiaceae bacterium]|nr:efflux RND transporter periplasmic adaptor subunit [Polyangiaceae bacterium]